MSAARITREFTREQIAALRDLCNAPTRDHVTEDVQINQQTGEALVRRGLATRHQYSTYLPVFRPTRAGRALIDSLSSS